MKESVREVRETSLRTPRFPIVAIGASAGGLKPVKALLRAMPVDCGIAFVVIQHLSSDFKSHMVELLSRATDLPVVVAEQSMPVMVNCVHLIPADKTMTIKSGKLQLVQRSVEQKSALPIDAFMVSLATDVGSRAIGIVLSGTGSDGTVGVQAISSMGGWVLVQDEESAQFDGMPINAIASGTADVVGPPSILADALCRASGWGPRDLAVASRPVANADTAQFNRIFALLRKSCEIDFSQYKHSTVGRRIRRRMSLRKLDELSAYGDLLESDPAELDDLYRDILIGVTQFFRDSEAFDCLSDEVLDALMATARETGTLRVWACGVASGEEAYSLAMLFDERISALDTEVEFKLLATDAHQGSLERANIGVFSAESVSELSEARRAKYFREGPDGFQVTSELRSMIVFTEHNVLKDAPFTQLDLVTCRNMLIYLQSEAQLNVLSLFHFGLRAGGFLFLGPSETTASLKGEFESINARWRIYKKRRNVRLPIDSSRPLSLNIKKPVRALLPATGKQNQPHDPLITIYDQLLDQHMPASLLISEEMDLIHSFGGAEQYLSIRAGPGTTDILDLLIAPLKMPVSSALQYVVRKKTSVSYSGVEIEIDETPQLLDITVTTLHNPQTRASNFLIKLETSGSEQEASGKVVRTDFDAASRIVLLENELSFSQESLQSTIEELESSNEELQTANEEMLSSNEELQNANEELHSVNEELYSVNIEHQRSIQELSLANDDMANLLAITRVGVLFLDDSLRIRRYTPEMARLFSLMPQDIGRTISGFNHSLDYRELINDVEYTISSGEQVERSVQDIDGTPYLLRIAPYSRFDEVSGAALMLIDISAMANAQKEIAIYKYLSDQTVIGQVLVSESGRIQFANPAFSLISGKSDSDFEHSTIYRLFPGIDRGALSALFKQPTDIPVKPFESVMLLDNGDTLPVELSPNLLTVDDKTLLFIAVQDITERHQTAQQMKLYESAIEATDSGITIADARAPDQPLIYVNEAFLRMTGYTRPEVIGKNCRFLQGAETDQAAVDRLRSAISAEASVRTVFLNYDRHGQPFWNDLIVNPVTNARGETTHFVGVANNVTERVEDALRLKDREAQVSAIVNATDQAIFGVDTNLRVNFVNSAAMALLGMGIDEIISDRRLDELLDLEALGRDQDGLVNTSRKLSSVVAQGQSIQFDWITLKRADGAVFSAEISTNPVRQSIDVTGAVVTVKNVTEQEAQSELLTRALEQADQASRAKSDFLANMSHEIRTPLTAVMGFTDLMSMSLDDQEQIENARAIKQNALHLLDLVNDILDLSKLESARLNIESDLVSLPALVAGLKSMHKMRAEQKNLALRFHCLTPIPQKIRTDPVRIRQVLVNLISNAVKFTEEGSISVEFEMQERNLIISVRDTGSGIAAEQLADMFLPFRQGTLGMRRGGTGLGLSISKHLMELLGGELTAQSEPGQGSLFRVGIPIWEEADQRMITEFSEARTQGSLTNNEPIPSLSGKILVAEDSQDVQKVINQLLTRAGATVTCVSDGIKALEAIRQQPEAFDLVLLDIRMPRLGGEEVVRQLQESGFSKPVVAITAHAMDVDHERYREIGFVDSMSKPIDAHLLLSRLAALMEGNGDSELDILLVEDHEQSRQVLVKLLKKLGYDVKAAANGAEALSLLRQLKPRVCLLDMGLPDMGGLDVVSAASEGTQDSTIKFVAMTGSISQGDRKKYEDANIAHLLAKPVDIAEIKKLLTTLL